jgi:hypothetical protein
MIDAWFYKQRGKSMKKAINIIVIIYFFFIIILMGGDAMAASNKVDDIGPPGPNEVLIGPNGVIMPLKRILLVRKDSDYCAIKFNKFWSVKSEEDQYASYESYYQKDKTGDLSKKNVEITRKDLHEPKGFWLFGHPWAFNAKQEIQCGPIKLWWTGRGTVYFFMEHQKQGDYGIELAPTKWTNISEINAFDSRIKWYRYDEKRNRINIPVDQLWDDKKK